MQWKTDDDDADFSFEPTNPSNNFTDMEFKPVVVPEWKDRNLEDYWQKNIAFAEPNQSTEMLVILIYLL